MKRKWIIVIFSITILAIILFGFRFINEKINGNPDKIRRTAQILKEQMEEKYNIVIIDSEGSYSHMVGYGAKLTTENNITFPAWERKDGNLDFYMEEVWRQKALDKWGYADRYIPYVKKTDINVGYRLVENKNIAQLSKPIEEVKNELWLTIYIDLKIPFDEQKSQEIENGIYNYYQQLQKDDANDIELIVRYDENKFKQDTGSYMIIRENGKLPIIDSVQSISATFYK